MCPALKSTSYSWWKFSSLKIFAFR